MTPFFKEIGAFANYKVNNTVILMRKIQRAINYVHKKYFTAGLHTKDVTSLDKYGIVPKHLPLANKYFKSLKTSKSLSAQAGKSRKEKEKIKDVVILPMASLGLISATQICTRTETSQDQIKIKNICENINKLISMDVTTIISSPNEDNLFTSLVTSSSSSYPKKN